MTATPYFSTTSPWNTPLGSGATYSAIKWPGSTGYNYTVNWDNYSPAVYVASASDPLVTVSYPAGWGYPGGTIQVHMPAAANGAAGTDGELIVIDNGVAYNFWQFNRTSTNTATAGSMGEANVVSGNGFGSKNPFLSAGTTAIGASELGGLLTAADQSAGSINHALQLVVDSTLVSSGLLGLAISSDGSSGSGIVKEGELLAIPTNMAMPSGLSALGQEVFTALQKYGAYVVDVAGGDTAIRAQSNAFDSTTMTALWHDMGNITPLLQAVTNAGTPASSTTPASTTTTPTTVTTPPPTTVTTPPPTTVTTAQGTDPATLPSTAPSAPTINWVAANGAGVINGTGTVGVGTTIRLAVDFSENVSVTGSPTITLNDGGVAKYVSGSGSAVLKFDYTVTAGQNTADLAITSYNLAGVKDGSGDAVSLSNAPTQPAGTLAVSTTTSTTGGHRRHSASTTTATLTASPTALATTNSLSASSATTGSSDQSAPATSGDRIHDRRMALLGQYAASSFHSPSLTSTGFYQAGTSTASTFLAASRSHA